MLNHCTMMGRLTADPEIRRTTTGKAVCSFTVAVDKPGKDSGASFIPCVAWEKTAEFIEKYFSKGSLVALEGRVESRQYETKDGQKRTVVELVASQAHFCGKKETETSFGKDDGFTPLTKPASDFVMLDGDDAMLPF